MATISLPYSFFDCVNANDYMIASPAFGSPVSSISKNPMKVLSGPK